MKKDFSLSSFHWCSFKSQSTKVPFSQTAYHHMVGMAMTAHLHVLTKLEQSQWGNGKHELKCSVRLQTANMRLEGWMWSGGSHLRAIILEFPINLNPLFLGVLQRKWPPHRGRLHTQGSSVTPHLGTGTTSVATVDKESFTWQKQDMFFFKILCGFQA